MVRNCVENFELKILSEFKLNKKLAGWMETGWMETGWMDGCVGGWESGFKDCLQQSKTVQTRWYSNKCEFKCQVTKFISNVKRL